MCCKKICRICIVDDWQFRLIAPCKCRGSMKYVHQECLDKWRTSRMHGRSYCEICNTRYLGIIIKSDRYENTLDDNYDRNRFLILFILVLLLAWVTAFISLVILLHLHDDSRGVSLTNDLNKIIKLARHIAEYCAVNYEKHYVWQIAHHILQIAYYVWQIAHHTGQIFHTVYNAALYIIRYTMQ